MSRCQIRGHGWGRADEGIAQGRRPRSPRAGTARTDDSSCSVRLTGEIKADGDISLADANAVALAADRHATLVVGPDDDFENPHIDFDPCQFRSDPV